MTNTVRIPSVALVAILLAAASTRVAPGQEGARPDRDEGHGVGDPESLAALLRPRLPKGWTLSISKRRVALERDDPIELYNGLQLPNFSSEAKRREYLRPNVRREKLVISLSLGDRISQEEYDRIVAKNLLAVAQANASTAKDNAKRRGIRMPVMPDEKLWQKQLEYGFRRTPSFDTGSQSIYIDCEPPGVVYVARPKHLKSVFQFWDKSVEKECQGVLEDLGMIFTTYKEPRQK
jgi:hypothetical protein